MELRAREARAQGKQPRRVQQWVSYRRISPNLTRAVLVAEDAAFWQHEGVDLERAAEIDRARLGARPAAARREHHHAAAREEPVPVAVEESRQKASRADHRAPARGGAAEGADSRAVPECDRMGRRHLRRRGGRPHVLRDLRVGAGTEGIRAAGRRHHQPAGAESGEAHGPSRPPAATDSEPHGRVSHRPWMLPLVSPSLQRRRRPTRSHPSIGRRPLVPGDRTGGTASGGDANRRACVDLRGKSAAQLDLRNSRSL